MTFTVDDQPYRQPKPPAFEVQLRDRGHLAPCTVQLPAPLVYETTMRAFVEAGGWVETERMGIEA